MSEILKNVFDKKRHSILLTDLCGTLIDSGPLDRAIMDEIGQKYAGKDYVELRKIKDTTKSMRQNFEIFFGSIHQEIYTDYIERLANATNKTKLFPNAEKFLKICRENNIIICGVTNRPENYMNKLVQYHKLDNLLNYCFSAPDHLEAEKPNPIVIENALKKIPEYNFQIDEVVFLGDTIVDVTCADKSGCKSIIITGGLSEFESKLIAYRANELDKDPVLLVTDFDELIKQIGFKKNSGPSLDFPKM